MFRSQAFFFSNTLNLLLTSGSNFIVVHGTRQIKQVFCVASKSNTKT